MWNKFKYLVILAVSVLIVILDIIIGGGYIVPDGKNYLGSFTRFAIFVAVPVFLMFVYCAVSLLNRIAESTHPVAFLNTINSIKRGFAEGVILLFVVFISPELFSAWVNTTYSLNPLWGCFFIGTQLFSVIALFALLYDTFNAIVIYTSSINKKSDKYAIK